MLPGWRAGRGLIRIAMLLTLTGAAPALAQAPGIPPLALPTPSIQTPDEALAQDAGEYARQVGVPIAEAIRRLHAQEETVPLTDRLQADYGDRLAGLYIEHQPVYRIVVLLTGTEPVPDQSVMAGGMTVPIVFRTSGRASRTRLLSAINTHQAAIRAALPKPPGMGVDPRTGTLLIEVDRGDIGLEGIDALRTRLEAIAGAPVRIVVLGGHDVNLQVAAPAQPSNTGPGNTGPIGGAPVVSGTAAPGPVETRPVEGGALTVGTYAGDPKHYACTTGFVVTDGARTGVVTAAHCADTIDYITPDHRKTPLPFVGQWGWGYQDVQLHLASRAQPLFYADTAMSVSRPVTGARSRTSTRAGDFVCHRGERTGYSCSFVQLVDFAPAGDLCGGACLPTWVAVAGPTCKGGDSGAPVFIGTTALGLVKAANYREDGTCIFYTYMSVDYLPSGWSLLEQAQARRPAGISAAD